MTSPETGSIAEIKQVGDRALKNEVYATIVDLIHRGKLRPGDRVSEADIANLLGISRGPVREAFGRLAYEGLMIHKARSGNFITELSGQDLQDIRDARSLIEGYAAARACTRITAEGVLRLRDIVNAMESAAQQQRWTEAASLNAAFHQTVVRMASSKVLDHLWQTLDPLAWLLASAAAPNVNHVPEGLVVRHQALIDALLSGDPAHASQCFRDHVSTAAHLTAGLDGRSESDAFGQQETQQLAAIPPIS